MAFLAIHGKRVSKMVALTICRGAISDYCFPGIVAWLLRWFVPDKYLQGANQRFITPAGTKSFYAYYRIGSDIQSNETEREPKRKGS